MLNRIRPLAACLLVISVFAFAGSARAADYTPGKLHNYSHEDGTVEKNNYQYSIFVPKDYDPKTPSPLVFYLHGGGKGRTHPSQGHRNMLTSRLKDNKRATDAGYSRNQPSSGGYILVSPVKPIATSGARSTSIKTASTSPGSAWADRVPGLSPAAQMAPTGSPR